MMLAYGNACYAAQALEVSLTGLLNTLEMYNIVKGVKNKSIDSENTSRVLGNLFKEAQKKEYFTNAEKNKINRAIKERNHLIHGYWKEKITYAYKKKGREWIIKNIEEIHELIAQANDIVASLEKKYLDELGVTDYVEAVTENIWESDYEPPNDLLH